MSAALKSDAAKRLAEAAAWRVHLTETNAETSQEFEHWLADPSNQAVWRRVESTWNRFAENPAAPELIAARRAALGDVRGATRRKRPWLQIAAAIGIVAGGAIWGAQAWLQWQPKPPHDLKTAFGERRVLSLNDGSRISLDSGTDVQVRYSDHARRLWLLHGQARFEVAHDTSRPFTVTAGGRTVIATGTDFDVDLPKHGVTVTLIEGHVKITGGKRVVKLDPGEQLAVLPDGAQKLANVNVNRVTAWQSGQLVFDNEPLSQVVERISRYSTVPVTVQDAKTGRLRMSGVFNTGDVAAFVEAVTHYLPVSASQPQYGAIVLSRKR
jgi:transmembrane sensor